MKKTIRIKLTMDAEKTLAALFKLNTKTKKDVIDAIVENDCESLLKRFRIDQGNSAAVLDNRRINSLKEGFKSKSGELKSYAISHDAKAILKSVSKTLNFNMGLTLSILLEDFSKALVKVAKRQSEEDRILRELAVLKEKISPDVEKMYKLWRELCDLYPGEEECSPFYEDQMYFHVGFDHFSPK